MKIGGEKVMGEGDVVYGLVGGILVRLRVLENGGIGGGSMVVYEDMDVVICLKEGGG